MSQKTKKIIRTVGLLVFLALGIKILAPYVQSIPESLGALKHLNYGLLTLAIFFEFLKYLSSGNFINSIIGLFKNHVSVWQATMIVLASSSFGMVGGGMAGSAASTFQWLRERNVKGQAALMAGILPILFSAASVLVLALVGMIYLFEIGKLTTPQIRGFLIILALIGLALVFIFLFFRNSQKSKNFVLKVVAKVEKITKKNYEKEKILQQVDEAFEIRDFFFQKGWKNMLFANSLIYIFDLLSMYFLFLAAGMQISPAVVLIGYGLPLILGKASFVLPGGIGVVESSMIELFQHVGVPYAESVVVALSYRFIAFLVPSILGFILVFVMQKKDKNKDFNSKMHVE